MKEKIDEIILKTIKKKFNIAVVDTKEKLLGDNIQLQPLELAILLKLLEEKFNINFKDKDITNGLFDSVSNISKLVEKELNLKG